MVAVLQAAAELLGLPAWVLSDNGAIFNGAPRSRPAALGPKPALAAGPLGVPSASGPRLDQAGMVTLRYEGRLRHIGVGLYAGQRSCRRWPTGCPSAL